MNVKKITVIVTDMPTAPMTLAATAVTARLDLQATASSAPVLLSYQYPWAAQ